MKRRSEISYSSENDANFNVQLFEHALKHGPSRNLILKLLATEEKSVFELFSKNTVGDILKTPTKRLKKKEHCESPTALLRRRELEKLNRPDSAQSDSSEKSSVSGSSSTLPFEKILRNVTAYVEIKSDGNDRSGGAKALLKSMGATVSDKFSRDVTHVIFKDGSYETYQRAKLLKVHFVSVLWLEAARRNGVRPPESNYPALGTKNYDQNVSLICSQMQKDYEDIIRDEIRRTLESGTSLPTTKSLIDSRRKTIASTSKRYESNSKFVNDQCPEDVEVGNILHKIRGLSNSQEPETASMILGSVTPVASVNDELSDLSRVIQNKLSKSSSDSFRPSSLNLEHQNSDILTSDSECGMIDGNFSRNKILIDETVGTSFKQNDAENSNMDITCSYDSENSDSRSLLSNRYSSRRISSANKTSHMDLTNLEQTNSGNPRSILKHLGQNIMNTVCHIASKANVLSNGGSRKRTHDKENHIDLVPDDNDDAEDDQFYRLKTPTLTTEKRVKPKSRIFPSGHVDSSIENVKGVNGNNSKEGLLNNQGSEEVCSFMQKKKREKGKRSSTEISSRSIPLGSKRLEEDEGNSTKISSLHISSNSNSKRRSEENKSGSTEMSSLHISSDSRERKASEEGKMGSIEFSSLRNSSDSKSKKQSEENISGLREISSLNISSDSKGRKISKESKMVSSDMSSLRISTSSRKTSNGTSMSSLKLSNSNIEKSGSTNMSSLRIYSDNLNSNELNDVQKLDDSSYTKKTQEDKANAFNLDKIVEENHLHSTPFVTDRKKRKNLKKSEMNNENLNNDKMNKCNINFEFTKRNVDSLEKTSENTRITRRENLAGNKEKRKFELDLKKRKDFHDKNKEIEFHFDNMNEKINITKSDIKNLNETPSKSGICESHFVNTRSRRKSTRHAVEEGEMNSYNKWHETTPIRRKSVRLLGQSLNQLIDDVIEDEKLSDLNSKGKKQHLNKEKAFICQESTGNCGSIENISITNDDCLLKTPRNINVSSTSNVSNTGDTYLELGSKKAVVLLENIIVSPQKDNTSNKRPLRKSKSVAKLEAKGERHPPNDKDNVNLLSSKNTSLENIESQDEVGKSQTQPNSKPNFRMSRSKSESDIKRRSRRIRKLYNPDESVNEEVVDDSEERDIMRQEKERRNKGLTQCTGVIGNVLLTQKAVEYLEKNKNKQEQSKSLSHTPESVLKELGIDKKEKKNKKESILNRSSDEQVALAEEFVHKKHRALSQTRKASQKTPRSRKSLRVLSQKSLTADRVNRRSTMEFESTSLAVPKAKTKLKLDQKPTIVCTKMHRQDVQMFNQIVRKLGTFLTEDEVTSRTTHLVVGEVKRTINLLRALARGCWILRQEWLLKSLEKGKWLPEEDYEATEFSPAVQKSRLEKSAFGPSYTMNIFLNCGPVYVAKSTTPRCSDLRELITICKGKISKMPDNAVISVGAYFDGCECVSEYWILDSISAGKLKPLKKYYLSKENGKSPFV
ncbi:hypothetical protein WA026_018429 [Henosepilachna vigintioctopunctata]|uniref:BRCT domain-containing protein n=1 Tax=Henosepilachna vigintioctopunctata TaxID=420089 RepID=A0AAW1V3J7_9CUCU